MDQQSLYVASRAGEEATGAWGPVGILALTEGRYSFRYTRGAQTLKGFRPFSEMPELDALYFSDALFPMFSNRLLSASRPEYESYLLWGGFDPKDPPNPISLLGVTEGRRATDPLELFPCPRRDESGCYVNKFFLHGVRWMPESAWERIERLKVGETLGLMLDISNPYDPNAVAVRTCDVSERYLLGYVPRYLAREITELCRDKHPDSFQLTVERVNSDAPLQQRLLCRFKSQWAEGFVPCSGDEYKPIVVGDSLTAAA